MILNTHFTDFFLNKILPFVDQMPPPGQYNLKTSFDGSSPTIKGNMITTNFKNHANRQAFEQVYVPGTRSLRSQAEVPGPGSYTF